VKPFKNALLSAVAISVLASAPIAIAQEADEEDSARTLGAITVTAQRREESIQDVSATINAFSGEQLERLRFDDIDDVASLTPNVDIKQAIAGNNSVITIRGVGLNDFSSNNTGSVGVYVDDVFLAATASLEFATFDTERLEVLKGPQGTLYGRNSTGGAVNIISRKPEDVFGGYASVSAGNFGRVDGEGAVTGPITENLSYRISGKVGYQGSSFFDDLNTGDDFGDRFAYGVRGQLAYEGQGWDALLKLQYSDDDGPSTPYKLFGSQTPESAIDAAGVADFLGFPEVAPLLATDPSVGLGGVGAFCAPVLAGNVDPVACANLLGFTDTDPDPRVSASNFAVGNLSEVETFDATLTLSGDVGPVTLTSISGYRNLDRVFGEDVDASAATLFENLQETSIDQFSQEFRVNYANDRLDAVTGLFFSYDEVDQTFTTFSDELFLTRFDISYEQETVAVAGFADVAYIVNDLITLKGGLRLTYEDRSYVGGTTDLNPFGISLLLQDPVTGDFFPDPLAITFTDVEFDEFDVSGRAVIEFTPTDNLLLYGSFSRAFKSGGVIGDITFANEELIPFEPETIFAYEVGVKADPLDWLRINASGFYYDYQDVQTFVTGSLGPVLGNADDAEVLGLDLELVVQPFENFNINFGLGLLDTDLGVPFEGNALPNAPDVSLTALGTYDIELSQDWTLSLQAGVKYSDDIERDAENTPVTSTDSYAELSARLTLFSDANGWELAVFGENITDTDFAQQTFFLPTLGSVIQQFNAPATYGASITKRF